MTQQTNQGVTVRILGKEYQIACPEGQQHNLIDAALLLDSKMSEIRKTGRIIGLERIAVMAALNLAHELHLLQSSHSNEQAAVNNKLTFLHDKIEKALTKSNNTHEETSLTVPSV